MPPFQTQTEAAQIKYIICTLTSTQEAYEIKPGRVRYTNQHFILLLFKILWVMSTEKGELSTCCNVKLKRSGPISHHIQ